MAPRGRIGLFSALFRDALITSDGLGWASLSTDLSELGRVHVKALIGQTIHVSVGMLLKATIVYMYKVHESCLLSQFPQRKARSPVLQLSRSSQGTCCLSCPCICTPDTSLWLPFVFHETWFAVFCNLTAATVYNLLCFKANKKSHPNYQVSFFFLLVFFLNPNISTAADPSINHQQ